MEDDYRKKQTEEDRKRKDREAKDKRDAEDRARSNAAHTAHINHLAHAIHTAHQMVQHVSGNDVRAARTARYSSPVTNNTYHYDQRTQFTGSIQVEAKDPNHLVDEIRKKVAHSRLVAPGRAALSTSI
jgi:hypothetical protein